MEAQHTPGPWRVEQAHDLWLEIIAGEGLRSSMIADCVRKRNARLIAAAPDLLEALEEVVRVFDSNPSSICDTVWVTGDAPETLYDHCRAAIAKAKGETK